MLLITCRAFNLGNGARISKRRGGGGGKRADNWQLENGQMFNKQLTNALNIEIKSTVLASNWKLVDIWTDNSTDTNRQRFNGKIHLSLNFHNDHNILKAKWVKFSMTAMIVYFFSQLSLQSINEFMNFLAKQCKQSNLSLNFTGGSRYWFRTDHWTP